MTTENSKLKIGECAICGGNLSSCTSNGHSKEITSTNQVKHTPGPWGYTSFSKNPVFIGNKDQTITIAVMDGHWNPTTQEENARLIASAPDLLEACKLALKRMMDFEIDKSIGNQNRGRILSLIAPLSNAIAKAEGGSK